MSLRHLSIDLKCFPEFEAMFVGTMAQESRKPGQALKNYLKAAESN